MDTPCATTACSKRLAAMCASETAIVPLLLPKLCPASAGCAGSAGWLCWPRSAASAANEMVCVIPTANGRWTADSQHAVDGLRTLDCWLEPTWSRRHQHGEPSKKWKLWSSFVVVQNNTSEIKPSYINRLAPLLRIHTAKSKRRRLGRRLCSAARRASNARCCGLWTLDSRLHLFINKNHCNYLNDWLNVVNASHPIEVLTKGPNPELGKDDENTVTNGCSSCGRGSAQEKNKKCAKWQPSWLCFIDFIATKNDIILKLHSKTDNARRRRKLKES